MESIESGGARKLLSPRLAEDFQADMPTSGHYCISVTKIPGSLNRCRELIAKCFLCSPGPLLHIPTNFIHRNDRAMKLPFINNK